MTHVHRSKCHLAISCLQCRQADCCTDCVPGLVETSNNLAAVKPSSASSSEVTYTITCSTRSSLTHAMEVQRARIAAIAGLCGARVEQDKAYPGWAPNPSSPVLQVLSTEPAYNKNAYLKSTRAQSVTIML